MNQRGGRELEKVAAAAADKEANAALEKSLGRFVEAYPDMLRWVPMIVSGEVQGEDAKL